MRLYCNCGYGNIILIQARLKWGCIVFRATTKDININYLVKEFLKGEWKNKEQLGKLKNKSQDSLFKLYTWSINELNTPIKRQTVKLEF